MIVQGTNEGLDAARARGVRLGRPPAMTPDQVDAARKLLPENSVTAIAKLLGVSRSTIYKYVPELKPALAPAPTQPPLPLEQAAAWAPMPTAPVSAKPDELECPSCRQRPKYKRERELFEDALGTVWLASEPDRPGEVAVRWYCDRCQPRNAELVLCRCGEDGGVMISSGLAGQAGDDASPVGQWLTAHGWIRHEGIWYCARHQRADA